MNKTKNITEFRECDFKIKMIFNMSQNQIVNWDQPTNSMIQIDVYKLKSISHRED